MWGGEGREEEEGKVEGEEGGARRREGERENVLFVACQQLLETSFHV